MGEVQTLVQTWDEVLQDKQGTSEIGLCQLVAASDAIYTTTQTHAGKKGGGNKMENMALLNYIINYSTS